MRITYDKPKLIRFLKALILVLIFATAIYRRVTLFHQPGSDMGTYIEAVEDVLQGKNPYESTVRTYQLLDSNPGDKGFANLPNMLYINGSLTSIHMYLKAALPCNPYYETGFCLALPYFWKLPILLADIGIGILLVKILKKRDYVATVFALMLWYFNPFIVLKSDYISSDPIAIFFMLLAMYKLGKDDVAAGASYALSIATKTLALPLLPIIFLMSKDKKKLVASGAVVALAISAPFMLTLHDFITMVQGAVLVHSQRFMQGRPLLFYISYWLNIELIQIIPLKVYTLTATFGGWILTTFMYFKNWLRDKYILGLISFMIFYAATPVLNRTYLLWFIPILSIGLYNFGDRIKNKYLFYVVSIIYWVFFYWYLAQWEDGFHIHARI